MGGVGGGEDGGEERERKNQLTLQTQEELI
jgi:hypothetical protein